MPVWPWPNCLTARNAKAGRLTSAPGQVNCRTFDGNITIGS